MKREIIHLCEQPQLFEQAAQWFHEKWKVPLQAYLDSMEEGRDADSGVPAWYILMENGAIIAGLGVIENDFHKRKDLRPNICAVYVEEAYRKQGIARQLLDYACEQLARKGISTVYLITGHSGLYERMGWQFEGMIEENDGGLIRMYRHDM